MNFKVTYLDFRNRTVVRYWRGAKAAAVRTTAYQKPDCKTVISIQEVSEAEFTAGAAAQRKHRQAIRNSPRFL